MPYRPHIDSAQTQDEVSGVALRALSILALDAQQGGHIHLPQKPQLQYLDPLFDASLSFDRARLKNVVDDMLGAGVAAEEISDIYVPTIARMLGEAWVEDRIDFAMTTIGSARLQGLLRSLGPDWCRGTDTLTRNQRTALVVVPQGAQHSLGATILAGQMRRRNISVNLEVGVSPRLLAGLVERQTFDAVLISASAREPLELVTELVQSSRTGEGNTPVVVGGNILDQMTDIKKTTGADLATSCLKDTIRFCSLDHTLPPRRHLHVVD